MTQPSASLPPSISGLRAGATVGGYRLLRRLGAGGMGAVWEVADEAGDRVAMKILHPQIAADPMARRRLDREAQVLARVRDARVARILDIETGDSESAHGMTFVITELVEGPTLQREVDREGAYDLVTDARDLSDLAHGLVDALRAVHAAGVIHRDLKPSNVMLGAQGPVLIDFGIAQVADDVRLTQTGQVTGTPGFIPPEMLDGDEPSPASTGTPARACSSSRSPVARRSAPAPGRWSSGASTPAPPSSATCPRSAPPWRAPSEPPWSPGRPIASRSTGCSPSSTTSPTAETGRGPSPRSSRAAPPSPGGPRAPRTVPTGTAPTGGRRRAGRARPRSSARAAAPR
ncbi:serine/threonine-protein kinase [Actinomyces denticolens]|uniref:serine/threonine-protein kinase n=1 Tax=Actinomyces denticolens TaxID=52767 RepID=UPI001FC92B81|nr:serine/threonine-protein kinase [Actinomyces denticolens]